MQKDVDYLPMAKPVVHLKPLGDPPWLLWVHMNLPVIGSLH
jgi:hypothetical protein